jgi:orotidine-5'-phosphate decarboxylase
LRQQLPHSLFLVPGVGAQKAGNQGIKACFNNDGMGAIISSSRAIMYPHLYGNSDSQAIRIPELGSGDLSCAIRQAAINLIQQVKAIV